MFLVAAIVSAVSIADWHEGRAASPDSTGTGTVSSASPSPPRPTEAYKTYSNEKIKLIGISVVEGDHSYAVFELPDRSVIVREGNEIIPGLRLVKVEWRGIDAESNGEIIKYRVGHGGSYGGNNLGRKSEGAQIMRERARSRVRVLTNLPGRD